MDIDLIINIAIGILLSEVVIKLWMRIKYTIIMMIMEANKDE